LKHRQYDTISPGAIETILERYWPAWTIYKEGRKAYQEGRYDEAIARLKDAETQLLDDWVRWQPEDVEDPFALHFQARIYELMAAAAEAKGDKEAAEKHYNDAFGIWLECMSERALDKLARRRLLDLYFSRGKPEQWKKKIPHGMNPYGLPETRVVGETEGEAPAGKHGDEQLAPKGKYRYRCLRCRARYGANEPDLTVCDACGGPLVKEEEPSMPQMPMKLPGGGPGGMPGKMMPGMKSPGMGPGGTGTPPAETTTPEPGHEGHGH
jgi:tetratricopeptide (TPR) repeat protein